MSREREILERLKKAYPQARIALEFQNPLQLLVATILSAQCTDERVNQVTPRLFQKYPDARALAEADLEELAEEIRSTGFYKQKARYLKEACRILVERYGGEVPKSLKALLE